MYTKIFRLKNTFSWRLAVIFTCCESGVRALALTPQDDFGDLPVLQGFKSRVETALWLEPVLIAGKKSLPTGSNLLVDCGL